MNTWTLTGRLGADAEIRDLQSAKVANFNVATDSYRKTANGEREKTTIWTRAKWFSPNEGALQYLKKGCKVLLQGRPAADAYTDRNGQLVAVQEMLVSTIEIIEFVQNGAEGHTNAPQSQNAPKVEDFH